MHFTRTISRAALLLATLSLACAITGCTRHAPEAPGAGATGSTAAMTPPGASAPSKLGDLSEFHRIAMDVDTLVQQGDLVAAKKRIKDLEVAWDAAEAGLKPRAAAEWHLLDKAIDDALAALRADTPTQANCLQSTRNLLKTFDRLDGKG